MYNRVRNAKYTMGRVMIMNYIAFGKRIRSRRRSMRLTQEQVAEQVGISLSFLGHIERGTRKASLETLVSICNVLKTSPSVLLRDSLLNVSDSESGDSRKEHLIHEISRVILDDYDL